MAREQPGLVSAWYRGSWWLVFLRPLEFFFRSVAAVRRSLYALGMKNVWRSPRPLVVVGNITVGGTGKTPVVIALVEALQATGMKPGVVSRGYGATRGVFPHTVNQHSSSADCGDEPLLIYHRTGCPCVVSPVRVSAVRHLLEKFDIDIVLCDDGLQHYALARDLEIAVLDENRRVGNGWCLPAGPLREPIGRLRDMDYVLYRGGDDPLVSVRYLSESLVNLNTGEELALSPAQLGKNVHALAGIGQPSQFFETLKKSGFCITPHEFADHYNYTADDLNLLLGKPIIMTEKDAVKCRELVDSDAWFLKISACIPEAVTQSVLELAKRANRKI